jgi:hypothetical protein
MKHIIPISDYDELDPILGLDRRHPTLWLYGGLVRITYIGNGLYPAYQVWLHKPDCPVVMQDEMSGSKAEWERVAYRVLDTAERIAGRIGV